nr:hypothetical protein [Candidatus Gracilibacteria bacterium]
MKLNSGDIDYCLGRNKRLEENLGVVGNLKRECNWALKRLLLGSSVKEQLSKKCNN